MLHDAFIAAVIVFAGFTLWAIIYLLGCAFHMWGPNAHISDTTDWPEQTELDEDDDDYDEDECDDDYDEDEEYEDDDSFLPEHEHTRLLVPAQRSREVLPISLEYGPQTFEIATMTLRLHAPHLFSDSWYETNRKELSAWSAEEWRKIYLFRQEMGLAS